MKYFTLAWSKGEIPEKDNESISKAYWSNIDTIWPNLSDNCRVLAKEIHLHDGKIIRVKYNKKENQICLSVKCGDLQTGYFDIDLIYSGIQSGKEIENKLEQVRRNPKSEIQYDEVDLDESGHIVHRILFRPDSEINLIFKEFSYRKIKSKDSYPWK